MAGVTARNSFLPISDPNHVFNNDMSGDSSADTSTTSSGDEMMTCSHCNYVSNSSSDMTQHRWEVHPLLTRRKQHLMMSSASCRKRPNSESSDERKAEEVDDETPNKRHTLSDVTDERSRKKSSSLLYECTTSTHELGVLERADLAKTNGIRIKACSLGDLSTIKRNVDETSINIAQRSEADNTAASSLKIMNFELVSKRRTSSTNTKSSPCYVTPICDSTSEIPTSYDDPNTCTVSRRRGGSDGDLHTLAKAASSMNPVVLQGNVDHSSSVPMEAAPSGTKSELSSLHDLQMMSQRAEYLANFYSGTSVPFANLLVPGSNVTHPYVTMDNDLYGNNAPFVPLAANEAAGLLQHRLQPMLPTPAMYNPYNYDKTIPLVNNAVDASFFIQNPFLGNLPPNTLYPMSSQSMPFYPSRSAFPMQDATKLHAMSVAEVPRHASLTTLSNVATKLLTGDVERKEEIPDGNRGISGESHKNSKEDYRPDIVKTATIQRTGGESNRSIPAAEFNLTKQEKLPRPNSAQFVNVSKPPKMPNSSKPLPVESMKVEKPHQRPQPRVQSMDDERVKSLERAMRNIDCCDPNERSNVLPFRCPDGIWRMVRSKRIGGAWLVQMPGTQSPAVYLSKSNQNNTTDTLNEWLKSKLNTFSDSLAKSSLGKAANNIKQSPITSSYLLNTPAGYFHGSSEPDRRGKAAKRQNPAVKNIVQPGGTLRNLLLSKTALA